VKPRERRRLKRLHAFERAAWESGAHYVCGVDEVGRGPLAGPVVACAVVIDKPLELEHLNDSKVVTMLRRQELEAVIRSQAVCVSLGWADVEEIDRINILQASRLAMTRALAGLSVAPCRVFVDAVSIPGCPYPQESIIDGDAKSAAIAAASIVAKVARDAHMALLDALFPEYGFAQHKGYATLEHLHVLARLGPCAHHRRSFAPVIAPPFDFVFDRGAP
jgi:ribonuclease HII